MKLSLCVSKHQWVSRAKSLKKYAELDSLVGVIDIYRGPSDYPRTEGLARMSENWSLRLGDRELLAVTGLGGPGIAASATAKAGLDAVLCGQKGRLLAQRSFRREERFVRFSSPEYGISAVNRSGRRVITDTRSSECASLRRGGWELSVESEEVCAFVALVVAARLESILDSPLLDFLP
ncbi:hypothetical protein ACIGXI_18040 [Kitasatospora aureofaciens]|uniref:hypothetical protein n=1 Tax=Kitasatospora aureofaciens TaxID=1894 RepID=UPI0037CA0FFE